MSALPDHVEISKSELRRKATRFAKTFADSKSEAAEKQTFWNEFFDIFGISTRSVGAYEVMAKRLSTGGRGYIDFLYPGEMAIEQKSLGENLDKAMDQLVDYLDSLPDVAMPRLLIACDFQNFYWKDLSTRLEGRFVLSELPKYLEMFWWLAGYRSFELEQDEEEANLVATDFMAKLHDAVLNSGYDPHALREWLTRILFCLFADDTQVWDRNAFTSYVFLHTREDGSDLGPALAHLFQILNTPNEKRSKTLDEDLAVFAYINGDLFEENLPIPSCDSATRNALLNACKFDWSAISPAIFGSMFMNVMTPAERRELGAHYTTEENILKTIRPLFLDQLEEELVTANSRITLDRLHDKIANLTFFDPACGCGNFLVIAYRELRRLESELWAKRMVVTKQAVVPAFDVAHICRITVEQFYGIEIEEFPARIARTALYLMDHKSNLEFSKQFGQYFVRFPIPASPHIRVDNALRFDWNDLLDVKQADFVFGNPPFVGMTMMSEEQQEDNRHVFNRVETRALRTGRFDYVVCWYEKAMKYIGTNPVQFAFVSTNSIFQGEQARSIGPLISSHKFEIDFAHTTFAWKSEARGAAHVHCVIAGLSHTGSTGKKRLFEYATLQGPPLEVAARNINAYLSDGPAIVLDKRREPLLPGLPMASKGSQPTDGGFLLVERDDLELMRADPVGSKYLRRFVQSHSMIHNEDRWCLWLVEATAEELRSSRLIHDRLEGVANWRRTQSKTDSVRKAASTPSLFTQIRQPLSRYLVMPEVSSSGRRYIPGCFFEPEVIAGNKLIVFPNADLWLFGLLHSLMWNSWMSAVSGRLKSDYSFSPSIGYFTFPFPELDDGKRKRLSVAAQDVLDARDFESSASLADLYDPVAMPRTLVEAHDNLDAVVDSLLAPRKKIRTQADRLGILFERYETLTSPLFAKSTTVRKKLNAKE
jgi:hypothetical protein